MTALAFVMRHAFAATSLHVCEARERVRRQLHIEQVEDEPPNWRLEVVCRNRAQGAVEQGSRCE